MSDASKAIMSQPLRPKQVLSGLMVLGLAARAWLHYSRSPIKKIAKRISARPLPSLPQELIDIIINYATAPTTDGVREFSASLELLQHFDELAKPFEAWQTLHRQAEDSAIKQLHVFHIASPGLTQGIIPDYDIPHLRHDPSLAIWSHHGVDSTAMLKRLYLVIPSGRCSHHSTATSCLETTIWKAGFFYSGLVELTINLSQSRLAASSRRRERWRTRCGLPFAPSVVEEWRNGGLC